MVVEIVTLTNYHKMLSKNISYWQVVVNSAIYSTEELSGGRDESIHGNGRR